MPPKETGEVFDPSETVIDEFDKLELPILERVLFDALIVLFVNVSVVVLPTKVSEEVGSDNVPELEIEEITGVVKVLFVSVCVPVFVTTVESIAKVTLLPDALELNPVPPSMPKVSLSRSIAIAVDPSETSRSCAVTSVSI